MNQNLYKYLIRLGDDSLIIGHRLSEWCGHGPILEEDIALTNFALDFIGQAQSILEYAGKVEGAGRDADDLAYLRYEHDFRNALLVEQPNGDFALTMMRQFLFDAFRKPLFEALTKSSDEQVAAIAEKSLKETKYHLKHSSEWIIRLGDGTEESHKRTQDALDTLWRYTDELFYEDETDKALEAAGIIPSISKIKEEWEKTVNNVLTEATLTLPTNGWSYGKGRAGLHSENLGYILAEMQYLQRAYPGAKW
ncbi:MAG: phenylacetate-CoA oxygenase subunit PaaC [Crocinitomicaceae bacterium]|nr:phenylacetate-CoA oxygenase subunit PaaC [Crocinitomicaceae bacterium]